MNHPDFLKRILRHAPGVKDQDAKQMVVGVLTAALVIDILLMIANINTWVMAIFGVLLLITLLLARRGCLTPGRLLAPFAGLVMIGFLMFRNYGLRDTAILGLPMILLSASLMVGRWGAVFYGALCLATIVALGWAEANGYVRTALSASLTWSDYVAAGTSIVLTTILQWLVIGRLSENTAQARRNEEAQKIANAALRLSEQRFRAIFENSGMGLILADLEGRLIEANPAFQDMLGYAQAELQGLAISQLTFPGDVETERLFVEGQLAAGARSFQLEKRYAHKDGRVIGTRMTVSFIYDDQARRQYALGMVEDVTERKQVEEQIQQRLHELATIHAVSQAAAAQLELDALFALIAQELFQLFDIQEMYFALHDRQTDLVQFPYFRHGDQRLATAPVPLGQGLSSRVIQSRQPLLINQDYERRSSELGVVRFAPAPVSISQVSWLGVPIQAGEQVIGMICVQNLERENAFTEADVRLLTTIAMNVGIAVQNAQLYAAAQQELAERKQIQQEREKLIAELETKNAELERFTYTVSHDLKSPLVTIRGFLGFVEKDALAGNLERLQADMARITHATDKMERLLSELLELSRIGRMMNPPQAAPFEAIAREAIELVHGRLAARGVRVEIAPDLPIVYGDRARLVEVVQNLADNACKFMGNQPEPRIEIGQRGVDADPQGAAPGKPILFVRDNGVGIEPQYHERVFGLFNKLDAQTEGTGVGLALVRRIVEVHGGRIWVESQLGQGATFCFTLSQPERPAAF